MTKWQIAIKSLSFYWRANLAVALGVAAATAVLTGALIVGESMRTSLRELTLDRLAGIDELIVSDGFFREQLAEELADSETFKAHYHKAVPIIMFPNGTVEVAVGKSVLRANNVNVLAVNDAFWSLDTNTESPQLTGYQVAFNQQLATVLGIPTGGSNQNLSELVATLRIPKPTQLPADSALGKTDDLVESLVDLEVVKILPDRGLGRFGLQPSQTDSPNIYVPISLLQEALCQSSLQHKGEEAFANVILLAANDGKIPSAETTAQLKRSLRPSLDDFGLMLKRATQKFENDSVFDYFSLSSDRLVLSDEAVESIKNAFPDAKPVLTYLANDIRLKGNQSGVPFSMLSSIHFDESFTLESVSGQSIGPLSDNEIVLNEWAADDLGAKVGDYIEVEFFEPETTHGDQTKQVAEFYLKDIAKLTEPLDPFEVRRRGRIINATFDRRPTRANDPNLTPEVPGVTDAETIEKWDLPFETADKLRSQDDDYWSFYRTTPKGFISLGTGQRLWSSRFGQVTSFQIPVSRGTSDEIAQTLLDTFVEDQTQLGFELIPIKRNAIQASSGSTPFDALFLALSMFVIGAALILVSLLFRLGLQSRANEVGILRATGATGKTITGIWLREMTLVCTIGALLGILLGVGYAALMILGLKTWWVGAISKPIIDLHVGPLSLTAGIVSGVLICILTIWWTLRQTRNQPVKGLLSGTLEVSQTGVSSTKSYWNLIVALLLVAALGLSAAATTLAGDAQAGAFMGSGFLVLTALLMWLYRWLNQPSVGSQSGLNLSRLALVSAKRNPLRSTLTIGLVAVASFLIAAVSSFRLAPTESGTAGFDFIGESSQPVFANLNTKQGQQEVLGIGNELPSGSEIYSFRLKPGQDASCNNLYQSTQPRVLGVTQEFIKRFDDHQQTQFAWGATEATNDAEIKNPWQLLNQPTADGAIPVIIDKNTANYSLKIFATGGDYSVTYDSGETVKFRVVGFLSNTILQGSLLISERNFTEAFRYLGGYRYFLIETLAGGNPDTEYGVLKEPDLAQSVAADQAQGEPAANNRGDARRAGQGTVAILENRLVDQGFDARSAPELLSQFMKVQNNYLSAFQALGALGLLLGTFGLATVQIRNVVERQRELGLMRAIGFSRQKLSRMVLSENSWLLGLGMLTGIVSALFATLPHLLVGSASMPWGQLLIMFGMIALVGVVTGFAASRVISRMPLLQSLRR